MLRKSIRRRGRRRERNAMMERGGNKMSKERERRREREHEKDR